MIPPAGEPLFDAHAHLRAPLPPDFAGALLPGVRAAPHPPELLADPRVHPALGLHPWYVPDDPTDALATLAALVAQTRPVAIGETGLDRSRRGAPRPAQERAFDAQIALATACDLPLILHVVRAHGLCLSLLRKAGFTGGGMVHDCRCSVEMVPRWVDAGFALSISPGGVDRAAMIAAVPDRWLLVETDEAGSDQLPVVIAAVAAARGSTPERIAELTRANAERVFGLGPA